jgi:hypothetical protein
MAVLEGFVRTDEAALRIGLSRAALERRLAAGEARVFVDPTDRRRRLIPEEDLRRLATPREIRRPAQDGPEAA